MRLRLRHPDGQSILTVPDDGDVQSLLVQIQQASGIYPSEQIVKVGYPPRPLTLVPELPLSSLGLEANEQLVVAKAASAVQPVQRPVDTPATVTASSGHGPEHVQTSAGVLVHRVVPDDNSCLFSSLALLLRSPKDQSLYSPPQLRFIVAHNILSNPDKFNAAILGMQPDAYAQTITKPVTWGGAIELTVLAQEFNVEICSIDVETGRVDQFEPEGGSHSSRCIVLYSGIHYDAATLAPEIGVPDEWHQTTFSSTDDSILAAAKDLATKLRAKRAFTNTATFTLRCEQCRKGLTGEKEARAHAEETGHVRFGEY